MSDLVTVRDENAPCKHGYDIGRCVVDSPVWCPGGREITLREVEADGITSDGEWLPAIVYVVVEE